MGDELTINGVRVIVGHLGGGVSPQVPDTIHVVSLDGLPHLRLCYDEFIARVAPDRECAWLLDVSGEPVKLAAWNSRLNGYHEPEVGPGLVTLCNTLLNELRARIACRDGEGLSIFSFPPAF